MSRINYDRVSGAAKHIFRINLLEAGIDIPKPKEYDTRYLVSQNKKLYGHDYCVDVINDTMEPIEKAFYDYPIDHIQVRDYKDAPYTGQKLRDAWTFIKIAFFVILPLTWFLNWLSTAINQGTL